MHEKEIKDVYMIESFIVDETLGINAPVAFKDISQGSWLITVKVDNNEVWDDFIKTGKFKAFSIEGLFEYEKINEAEESVLEEIADIVKGVCE